MSDLRNRVTINFHEFTDFGYVIFTQIQSRKKTLEIGSRLPRL